MGIACAMPPQQAEVIVAEYLLDVDRRRTSSATTFRIVRVSKHEENYFYAYKLDDNSHRPLKPHFNFGVFHEDANTSFTSLGNNKAMVNMASPVSKNSSFKANLGSVHSQEDFFSLDYNSAKVAMISKDLFAKSKLLEGAEAKVLDNTIRRLAKSTPTLPNRR